ncbi:hypothetical protein, partial [Microcystis sp. T1-4]
PLIKGRRGVEPKIHFKFNYNQLLNLKVAIYQTMTITDLQVNLSTSEDFLDSETLAQIDLMQQKIQQYLQTLSLENLKTILEFAAYLSDKESEQATQEIREIPKIIEKLKAAEMDLQSGHLIDWKNSDD